MRRALLWWIGLISAASAGLTLEIDSPFMDAGSSEPAILVRPKRWFTLGVSVSNDGADLRGQLAIARVDAAGGLSDDAIFLVDIDLPKGSKKREELVVCDQGESKSSGRDRYRLQLIADGEVVAERLFDRREVANSLVLLEVSRPGTYSGLAYSPGLNDIPDPLCPLPVQRMGIVGERLPRSAHGLEVADVVILHDVDFSTLPDGSDAALVEWVQSGGQLILTGATDLAALAGTALAKILPATVKSKAPLAPQGLIAHFGSIRTEGEVGDAIALQSKPDAQPFGPADAPYWTSLGVGRGRVTQLSFHPRVFAKQEGLLLTAILRGARASAIDDVFYRHKARLEQKRIFEYGLIQTLADADELRPPSIGLLLCLLVAYVTAASLGNYALLKLLKRRELSLLTTPAIAIAFAFLFYMLGYFYKGATSFSKRMDIVEVGLDGRGRVFSHQGIFSVEKTRKSIEGSAGSIWAPIFDNDVAIASAARRQACTQDLGKSGLDAVDFDQWSFRLFHTRSPWSSPAVSAQMAVDPVGYSGTVTNLLDAHLGQGWILTERSVIPVPAIGAGKSVSVQVNDREISQDLAGDMLRALFPGIGSSFSDDWQRTGLLAQLRAGIPRHAPPGHTPALYIAVADRALNPVSLAEESSPLRDGRSLILADMSIEAKQSPKGGFSPHWRECSTTSDVEFQRDSFLETTDEIGADFWVGQHPQAKQMKLIFKFRTPTFQWKFDHTQLEGRIYNWRTGRFVPLPKVSDFGSGSYGWNILIPAQHEYIHPVGGWVRFEFKSKDGQTLSFSNMNLRVD